MTLPLKGSLGCFRTSTKLVLFPLSLQPPQFQPPQRLLYPFLLHAGVVDHKAVEVLYLRIVVEAGEGLHPDAEAFQPADEGVVLPVCVYLHQKMQACILLENGQTVGGGAVLQCGNHAVAAALVEAAHAVDVLFKLPPAQEPGQRVLLKAGHGAAVEAQLLLELRHQRPGQHHVADTDGGGEALGEGVHIDDPLRGQTLHGGQRVGGEAEFGVVIVLDNPFFAVFCPVQQLFSAA